MSHRPLNDLELCEHRALLRKAYGALDKLQAAGEAGALFNAYHHISNAAEQAKERLNKLATLQSSE